jgi:Ca2+-dependent lipid-binding protein
MDPYVVIETRQQKVRTKTMLGAGKTPQWNQLFDIDVKYIGDDMKLQCFDEDVSSSDLIGEVNIKLSSLCVNGEFFDEWFSIADKGKQSGQIHLKGKFQGK